ncbi:MAG: helix-turn-helix transcriptional regulator [Clostridia bacterium]|nr:helix-turn-helix transcriptional regulator [Clostridia bacterium]
MNRINERVVEFLNDENLKLKELAVYLKMDVSIIHTWRRNESYPSTRYLIKLCEYFDCSVEYMLNRTEEYGKGVVEIVDSFANRVKFLMKLKNKTTYQMVKKDHVCSSSAFDRWFKKNVVPSPETLVKLADYFNVTVDYLLGRE